MILIELLEGGNALINSNLVGGVINPDVQYL